MVEVKIDMVQEEFALGKLESGLGQLEQGFWPDI